MAGWDDVAALCAHRAWPPPASPWMGRMVWRDLLFLHAPVPPEAVGPLPAGLALDLWEGEAWLSAVAFRMEGVALRGGLRWPGYASFPELNVRTYVTAGGRPGVWFLSLDAAAAPLVALARRLLHLPYLRARMTHRRAGGEVAFASERTDRRAPPARLVARARPRGEARLSEPGSLDHWLLERYALYAAAPGGLRRLEVNHAPYAAREVEADVEDALPDPWPRRAARSHFVDEVRAVAWRPAPVASKP